MSEIKTVFCPHCKEAKDIRYLLDHLCENHGYDKADASMADRLYQVGYLDAKERDYINYVIDFRKRQGKRLFV